MLGRLRRAAVPAMGAVLRRARPRLVAYTLTDAPVVGALRRAADAEAVVAVYEDGAAPHATAESLERELDVSVPPDRDVTLPSVPAHALGRTRRTVRALTLQDADPPVVLLSRRSLDGWDERTRNFVLAHEFGHVRADAPAADDVAASLLPAPGRSALAVRALAAAYGEYRAGVAHAEIRSDLPERHRAPASVAAEYHAVERARADGPLLSPEERRAVAIRDAAKYFALPYEPVGVDPTVQDALARPFPRYLEWVAEAPRERNDSS